MDGQTWTSNFEGLRFSAYDDKTGEPVPVGGVCLGTLTIGIGHTGPDVVPGLIWTQAQCQEAFDTDYATAVSGAMDDAGNDAWLFLNEERQAALVDVCFEIGEKGLRGFHKMISAILLQDWATASAQLIASKLASEVPGRDRANAALLLSGTWPA